MIILLPDLLGHGKSQTITDSISFQQQAQCVIEQIQQHIPYQIIKGASSPFCAQQAPQPFLQYLNKWLKKII